MRGSCKLEKKLIAFVEFSFTLILPVGTIVKDHQLGYTWV